MSMRDKRTILFSTHFLEEADHYSDNIILLSNGSIIENNSAFNLKQIYNYGFKLILFTNNNKYHQELFFLIKKYLIYSDIEFKTTNQLIIKTHENSTKNFEPIFDLLENLKINNFILNYSLINSTLGIFFTEIFR